MLLVAPCRLRESFVASFCRRVCLHHEGCQSSSGERTRLWYWIIHSLSLFPSSLFPTLPSLPHPRAEFTRFIYSHTYKKEEKLIPMENNSRNPYLTEVIIKLKHTVISSNKIKLSERFRCYVASSSASCVDAVLPFSSLSPPLRLLVLFFPLSRGRRGKQ